MSPLVKKKQSVIPLLFLAFAVPALITYAAFYVTGIAPFGDTNMLMWDLKYQYKDYFGYMWDVLHGDAGVAYSAGKSLGGKLIGLWAYYLTSPLNIILLFFKKSQLGIFISVITVLKIAFSGLTSAYFVKKRFNIHSAAVLLLSTSYALMEYNIYYCRNIMWLDGVVMLPLICLGVYEVLYNKKKGLLFFSVPVAIISNWYTGYMACLMAGVYFLFELALKYDYKDYKNSLKNAFSDCVRTLAAMVIGVMISAVVLLPSCLSLVGTKANFRFFKPEMNFSWLYTFTGFDLNATINTKTSPVLYCGGIAVLLVAYLFFDKRIHIKKRIAAGVLFLFMTFSFCFKQIEVLWTAFVESYSFFYRYAFVFGFTMILLSAAVLYEIQKNSGKINKSALAKALLLIGSIVLVLDLTNSYKYRFYAMAYAFVYIVYAVLLLIIYSGKGKSGKLVFIRTGALIAAAGILFAELGVNSALAYREYNLSNSELSEYIENTQALVDELEARESSFYRFEKSYSYLEQTDSEVATCEAMMFGYNGIEHYSSTYDPNADRFFAHMGYSDPTDYPEDEIARNIKFPTDMYWNSPLLLTDSILGIKYLMHTDIPYLEKTEVSAPLPQGYSVYVNPYALPLAYNVADDMTKFPQYGLNPFENQEMLLSLMLGRETQVYSDTDIELSSFNDGKEVYTLTATEDGPMYVYTEGTDFHSNDYKENCELYVDGEYVQNICQRFLINAVYIGDYKAGDTVELEIRHISDSKDKHTLYTAQLNFDEFEKAINTLSSASSTDLNINGSTISGTYTTDTDSTVMITIPYAESWQVYVDGEKTEFKELAGTFMGIDLTAGTHTIEMKFKTPYMNAGIVVTVAGLVLACAWTASDKIFEKRRKK